MVGSIRSLRSVRSRARIRSSSAPVSRENPTTSDTKIAASFRVSVTALAPKPDHRSQMAWARLHYHAALRRTWKQGVQAPRVDRPVYPRRVEHNTVVKEGIERTRSATRVRPPPA